MLGSLALHLLLILLAVWLFRRSSGSITGEETKLRSARVVLADASALQTRFLDRDDVTKPSEPNSTFEPAPSRLDAPGGLPDVRSESRILTPAANQTLHPENMTGSVSGEYRPDPYELSQADKEAIRREQELIRSQQPIGEPATLSVFGMGNLTGRSFVFVVDRSHSMGASGLGVLHHARRELYQAVRNLEPHHQFQVVAYNQQSALIQHRKLLDATPANREGVKEFFDRLAAHGSTVHVEGLTTALTFRPDVVVLITDGGHPGIHAADLKTLRLMAGNNDGYKRTAIHCLQFGNGPTDGESDFMKQLATQNHGSYRYVDVNEVENKQGRKSQDK